MWRHKAQLLVVAVAVTPGIAGATPASKTLIDGFAPELVGKVLPAPALAGDYAMSLNLSFDTFPTMEMHITESRRAAMRMTLTPAGTVRACVGMVKRNVTNGQWHYKPAGQREHRESEHAQLAGLAGTWRDVGGVAHIELDALVWNTCDLAKTTKLTTPFAQLRCVGAVANPNITVATLLCEAAEEHQLLGLGLPMTPASRTKQPERIEQAPRGKQIILGAPGLVVTARQSRGPVATFTFKGDAIDLVEKDYLTKPKPIPPPPPPPPRPKAMPSTP